MTSYHISSQSNPTHNITPSHPLRDQQVHLTILRDHALDLIDDMKSTIVFSLLLVRRSEALVRPASAAVVRSLLSSSSLKSHRELTDAESLERRKVTVSTFPCGDKLDVKIFSLALPAMLNVILIPLTSAIDIYYIGKMNNALAIAGSAAACQLFNSIFWVLSFLPLLVSPLVARAHAKGDTEATTERITEALVISLIIGISGNVVFTTISPNRLLNIVLPVGAASRVYAEPYLFCRITTFIPAILSAVCFSSFRGMMDVLTPLKISIVTNLVNA